MPPHYKDTDEKVTERRQNVVEWHMTFGHVEAY